MKYNIIINQKELADTKLDIKDAAILDYLIMYCSSKSEKIEKQRIAGATWINYQALIDDLPMLRITTGQSLTPRFKKIVEAGYITSKIKTVKGNKNLFVKLTQKVDSLFVETIDSISLSKEVPRENKSITRETNDNHYTTDNTTTNNYTKDYIYSLPEILGKNYQKRIWNFYTLVWHKRYGFDPDVNWKILGKQIKGLYESYSEYQVAVLILTHFDWHGASGSDEFAYKRLVEACFPFNWIQTSTSAYKAHQCNVRGLKFDSEEACKKVIDEYLKANNT